MLFRSGAVCTANVASGKNGGDCVERFGNGIPGCWNAWLVSAKSMKLGADNLERICKASQTYAATCPSGVMKGFGAPQQARVTLHPRWSLRRCDICEALASIEPMGPMVPDK